MESQTRTLDQQIRLHNQQDQNQGLIQHVLSAVWDGGSLKSLQSLQTLKTEVAAAEKSGNNQAAEQLTNQVSQAIADDRQRVERRDTYLGMATGALETAFMVLGGSKLRTAVGLAGTAATYALDSMKTGSDWKERSKDALLGASKGLAMRTVFQTTGRFNPVVQGLATGITGRFTDYATNRGLYQDDSFAGIAGGLAQSARMAFDPQTLKIDGVVSVAGGLAFAGANRFLSGALVKSNLVRTMVGAGSFGFASGASGEMMREQSDHESFDLNKVLMRGALQGALSSIAVAPGASIRPALGEAKVDRTRDTSAPVAPAPAQTVEYRVVAGRDALDAFIAGSRDNNGGAHSAMLTVESLSGEQSGPKQRKMLIQHNDLPADAERATRFAGRFPDGLVATCKPAMLSRIARRLHALPQADQVGLSTRETKEGMHIALTAGDTVPEGYTPAFQLGERAGLSKQKELIKWALAPVEPGEATTPLGKLRAGVHAELKNGWKLFMTTPESVADQVGMDYLLVHNDGRYHFFDTTLDADAKISISKLRKDAVVQINTLRDDFNTITTGTKFALLQKVLEAMRSPDSVLNWKETGLPDYKVAASNQQSAEGIGAYRKRLLGVMKNLNQQAGTATDVTARDAYHKRATLIDDYLKDTEKAEKQAAIRRIDELDPHAQLRNKTIMKNVETAAQDEVIKLLTGQANMDYEQLAETHSNRMTFDPKYDKAMFRYKHQTYPIHGIGQKVKEVVDQAVSTMPGLNMEMKRWMLSEGGVRTIRNRTLNRLGQMDAGELTGQAETSDAASNGAAPGVAVDPIFESLKLGDLVEGQVVNIIPSGVFVQLSPTATGFVRTNQLGNVAGESIDRGDTVRAKVSKIERDRERITLTMQGVDQPRIAPQAAAD